MLGSGEGNHYFIVPIVASLFILRWWNIHYIKFLSQNLAISSMGKSTPYDFSTQEQKFRICSAVGKKLRHVPGIKRWSEGWKVVEKFREYFLLLEQRRLWADQMPSSFLLLSSLSIFYLNMRFTSSEIAYRSQTNYWYSMCTHYGLYHVIMLFHAKVISFLCNYYILFFHGIHVCAASVFKRVRNKII